MFILLTAFRFTNNFQHIMRNGHKSNLSVINALFYKIRLWCLEKVYEFIPCWGVRVAIKSLKSQGGPLILRKSHHENIGWIFDNIMLDFLHHYILCESVLNSSPILSFFVFIYIYYISDELYNDGLTLYKNIYLYNVHRMTTRK